MRSCPKGSRTSYNTSIRLMSPKQTPLSIQTHKKRIERHPEKDRLTGHPAVRFILNPKEITGNEKGEYSNNLRFNRDKTSD